MRTALIVIVLLAAATPARAQTAASPDAISIRATATVAVQWFSATNSFDTIFGRTSAPLWGVGARLTTRHLFVEAGVSRVALTGERVAFSEEETVGLDIPVTMTLTPIEVSGGYRFRPERSIVPYAGAGIGAYRYTETSAPAGGVETIDLQTTQAAFLLVGGTELRAHRWIGLAFEVQYTYVPGILGEGGISQATGERNLGGVAVRFKALLGP